MSWWHMLQAILSDIRSNLEVLQAGIAREREATDWISKQLNSRAPELNERFAEHRSHGT